MKSALLLIAVSADCVAPFAGAWIEIYTHIHLFRHSAVAPFAGAWIEICMAWGNADDMEKVAPFAGAWIEIFTQHRKLGYEVGRSLRGSVD